MNEKMILTSEQDCQYIQSELNAGKKPSKTLRFMVQALENYRQSKKYGWSRPWNKDGVINFQNFKLNERDAELLQLAHKVIVAQWPQMPDEARQFIEELLNGETAPLGFIFFQECTENGAMFEGAVVSYGRINKENRRYRDRLDLILESPVNQGISQGLTRLRIYADPFLGLDKKPMWQDVIDNPSAPQTQQLFDCLTDASWAWADDKNRIWEHWITNYIDYFGPRKCAMQKSYFYVPNQPNARIEIAGNELYSKA